MFFIISKILDFAVAPITWIFLILLIALFAKNAKKKQRVLMLSFAVFYFFTNQFIFDEAMRRWEEPLKNHNEIPNYDIGIVLGGMVRNDASVDQMQFMRGSDRFLQALRLYKEGKIKKIFITGGSGSLIYPDMKEALLIKEYLRTLEIPDEDVLIESNSKNTWENALYTKKILDSLGLSNQNLLLITSGFHMRRSKACFEKSGLKIDTYAADKYSGARRFHPDHLLLPHAETLFNWNVLTHEWLGCIAYKVSGYN